MLLADSGKVKWAKVLRMKEGDEKNFEKNRRKRQ